MKKILIILFASCIASNLLAEKLPLATQKELVSSLNYLQYSTARIKMSENKAIAEDIYYSIINELKIEAISNKKLNFEYGEFLTHCANLKLTQNEKDFIKQLNEKEQKAAYLSAFSNIGSIFVPGQSPQQMVVSLFYTSVANAFAIANTKNQLKTQLEKDMFYLDQNVMKDIYNMQTSLFTTSAELLGEANAKGRINENSMNIFMNAIKQESPKERKYALCEPQLQLNMSQFPPYWYELGNAYQELGEITNALEAYDKFVELKQTDIVIKDKNYVNLIKNRIQILLGTNPEKVVENAQKNKNTILEHLKVLKSNYLDSEAGEKNIYLAKIYYLIGNMEESLSCLNYIIESKSVHQDYIEEAVALKLLIESAKTDKNASLYQNAFNFSKIRFGNADVDYSELPTKKGWFRSIIDSFVNFFKGLFTSDSESKKENETEIDTDYLCIEIPNAIIDNYDISFEIEDNFYSPHIFNKDSTKTSLCFIEYDYDDIEEGTQIIMCCKSKTTRKDIIITYSISPIKKKYVRAAEKAYKRLGSDITAHNAQTVIEFGEIVNDYDYEVDDEEDLREDIREEKEKDGKKNNQTKEEINSEITKELMKKLSPDMKFLQDRVSAIEKAHYKNKNNLYCPSLITYDDDYYLVGIVSIRDYNAGAEYSIDSDGNIEYAKKRKTSQLSSNIAKLESSAYSGNIKSMVSLGITYIEGHNTPKDPKAGIRWLLAAVNSDKNVIAKSTMDIAQAYKYLGECYWNGIGVNKDKKQARKYFRKSKEYGFDIDEDYL